MELTVNIEQDQDPMNPREWDNLGTMVCWHSRYILGDEQETIDEGLRERIEALDAAIALPLYLYDHSGITMSVAPFSCPWDSGQVGVIYATREAILESTGRQRLTQKALEEAERLLRAEVAEFDEYLTGDVWVVSVVDADTGETIDSVGGFHGYEHAEKEGEQMLAWARRQQAREDAEAKDAAARDIITV